MYNGDEAQYSQDRFVYMETKKVRKLKRNKRLATVVWH